MPENYSKDVGHSPDPDLKKKWYATVVHKPDSLWNKVADEMMIKVAESGHPATRGTSASEDVWKKAEVVEKHRYITTRNQRLQSHHCASLAPSFSLLSKEPTRIGAKILLSKSQLILHPARGHPLRTWRTIPRLKSHHRTYRTSPVWNSGARGDSVGQHEVEFENLPEDLQSTKAGDDAGSYE